MKNDKQTRAGGGIGFIGALTIAFIVLKLCGVIDWSWVWVLSPLWIVAALVVVVLLVSYIFIFIRAIIMKRNRKNKWGK